MAVSLGLRGIKYVIPSRLLRRGSVARAKVSLLSTVATQHDVRNLMLEKFVRSRAILRQLIKRFYVFFLFFFFFALENRSPCARTRFSHFLLANRRGAPDRDGRICIHARFQSGDARAIEIISSDSV